MIIQIIGLPGSGKTALAQALKERINAIHLNADEVRSTVNSDLSFTPADRIEQARRMGEMARLIAKQNVAPVIRFEDTNKLWKDPINFHIRILEGYTVEQEVNTVIQACGLFDWSAPTTLQLGRYQPWHEGHQALKEEAHKRTDQVLVGVRNTYNTSEKDPLMYDEVSGYIKKDNPYKNTLILRLPNITNIVYGRDVGYKIEQVDLGAEIHAISATQKRKEMGI